MASFGELLGAEIKKARTKLGWTQRALARASFPDEDQQRQIRRYERGETKLPNPKAFIPICDKLNIPHETIFELIKMSDNRASVDASFIEKSKHLSPTALANRVRDGDASEQAACDLHYLIILNRNVEAISVLEELMADTSLPLVSLDYCFRYYHFAFREELEFEMHERAIKYLHELLLHENFDISDKAAFSIGEIFLYNPHAVIRDAARQIIESDQLGSERVQDFMKYTKRRVGL